MSEATTTTSTEAPTNALGGVTAAAAEATPATAKEGAPAAVSSEPPKENPPAEGAKKIELPENWKEMLGDEYKDEASLGVIHDFEGLVKSYVNAQKMIGKDKIPLPDKFATEDDWKRVYHKLGLPEDIKAYELKVDKDGGVDEEFVNVFKEKAFEAGVLPRQAQKMLDWYAGAAKQAGEAQMASVRAEQEEGFKELRKEWGVAFPKHIEAAKLVIKDFGDAEVAKLFNETPIGNDPQVVKLLAKIGMSLKEADLKGTGEETPTMTPKQAMSEYNKILADGSHPYHVKAHPNHNAAVQEVRNLFQMANPSGE